MTIFSQNPTLYNLCSVVLSRKLRDNYILPLPPPRPDRLWSPLSLLCSGYQGLFFWR